MWDGEVYVENADLNCSPQNEYVSEESVSKIDDVLEKGEKVHFLARGNGKGVKIRSSRIRKERKTATKGFVRTAATDHRIVCKIPNMLSDDDVSIPYYSITDIDFKSSFMQPSYLIVHIDTKTYRIDISHLHSDEGKRMTRFIQEKISEVQYPATSHLETSGDPLDKLERLEGLKNNGVITEEEFAEKKESLLDQI